MRSWKAVGSVILAGVLCVPMWGAVNPNGNPAQPGTQKGSQPSPPQPGMLNYIEGQASMGTQALNQNSVGSVQLQAGQSVTTQNGRVELLLTPGVLLRLDNNSALMMNSAQLENTEATLQGGRAMIEAGEVLPANYISIHEGPATVRIMKNGLYDFDAVKNQVRVFDGRAEVGIGGKTYTVQGGHEFDLSATKLKARGFDKKAGEDAFYRWGSLRSSYLAEANVDAARGFSQGYYSYGYAPYAYGYPGWFWDPYFSAYTWLPGDGIFYSPFGWGFYSPGFVYAAPFYGYGFRGGVHHFGPAYRPPVAARAIGAGGIVTPAGRVGGTFNGNVRGAGIHTNGFAGGGFRGGGMGGGFHGGGGGRR